MSVSALSANAARRRPRAAARTQDPINPARGVMVGLGLSALIWTAIGALVLG